jgi:hypothetical protein
MIQSISAVVNDSSLSRSSNSDVTGASHMMQGKDPLFPVPLPGLSTCKHSSQTAHRANEKKADQSSDDLVVTNTLVPASIAKSPGSCQTMRHQPQSHLDNRFLATHLAGILVQHLCPLPLCHLLVRRRRSAGPDRTPGPAVTPQRRASTTRVGARLRGSASHGRRSKRVFRDDERGGYSSHTRCRRFLRGKDARLKCASSASDALGPRTGRWVGEGEKRLWESHSPCASRACPPPIRASLPPRRPRSKARWTTRGGVAMAGQGRPPPMVSSGSEKETTTTAIGTMWDRRRRRQRTRARLQRRDRPTPRARRRRCSSWAGLNVGKGQGPR